MLKTYFQHHQHYRPNHQAHSLRLNHFSHLNNSNNNSNHRMNLTDQIDLLFGSSQPSTSSARKVYSNSFSFQQQQQQQSEQQQEQDLHQLDLYHHLPLNDHHEFNFLFNPDYHLQQQPNPPPDQSNPEFNTEDAYDMMNGLDDDLLDRLDNGLINNSNHEEFKLNELDSKIENSIGIKSILFKSHQSYIRSS
ncbi:hypothetical protein Pst134EA_026886 [Puccinia striiformis f. sp. tritici]|uniref:hypothetical protein n=1 Tax=Puccinia striiformis f. sp. tritici TaxID=168172 RepID=UPI00200808B8|nr:hypothetical protein Pst134EA_026886 [Puccinia striiformis f. sp. tritici]KAH9450177.1 hypothetical protein Pst134EA_026886 [Puccinia striiformis f. sp. tritici]